MRSNLGTLDEMGIPPLDSGADGSNVAIAFIDYGFDILHPCLRTPVSGRTRFKHLWDQGSRGSAGGGEFERAALDALIARAEAEASRLPVDGAYDPHANGYGRDSAGVGMGAAHGTLMASIAAPSPYGHFRGVAPAAALIGVHLALPDDAWKEEDSSGRPTWSDRHADDIKLWDGWRSYDQ